MCKHVNVFTSYASLSSCNAISEASTEYNFPRRLDLGLKVFIHSRLKVQLCRTTIWLIILAPILYVIVHISFIDGHVKIGLDPVPLFSSLFFLRLPQLPPPFSSQHHPTRASNLAGIFFIFLALASSGGIVVAQIGTRGGININLPNAEFLTMLMWQC